MELIVFIVDVVAILIVSMAEHHVAIHRRPGLVDEDGVTLDRDLLEAPEHDHDHGSEEE